MVRSVGVLGVRLVIVVGRLAQGWGLVSMAAPGRDSGKKYPEIGGSVITYEPNALAALLRRTVLRTAQERWDLGG